MVNAAHAMFAADPASRRLGIELVDAAEGHAVARMRITESMINGHDIAHGGYVFLLADTAFACACNSFGPVTVASGADITFVASARLGDELVATAALRTGFGRNGIYDVTVRRDGEVIAEFRGRSRTIARSAVRADDPGVADTGGQQDDTRAEERAHAHETVEHDEVEQQQFE